MSLFHLLCGTVPGMGFPTGWSSDPSSHGGKNIHGCSHHVPPKRWVDLDRARDKSMPCSAELARSILQLRVWEISEVGLRHELVLQSPELPKNLKEDLQSVRPAFLERLSFQNLKAKSPQQWATPDSGPQTNLARAACSLTSEKTPDTSWLLNTTGPLRQMHFPTAGRHWTPPTPVPKLRLLSVSVRSLCSFRPSR